MLEVIRGASKKEVSTSQLIEALQGIFSDPTENQGLLYIGYPILSTVVGGLTLDAVLVTQTQGMVVFDLIEGTTSEDRSEDRDKIFANTQSRLIQHENLREGRALDVGLEVLTYAPQVKTSTDNSADFINDNTKLSTRLETIQNERNQKHYKQLISVVQAVTKLSSQRKRNTTKIDSRGAKLKVLEASIANLDSRQNRAVIETADGPQRIRGLAGSGKTIILALKAAYLHARYPEWDIAITFNTRSLKAQFVELVTKFTIEQSGEDPDWEKIKIVQSWGSHSSPGIYYDFCVLNGIEPLDFKTAKFQSTGRLTPLGYASYLALKQLREKKTLAQTKYDAILVDEAQDLSPAFLKLCYEFLKQPKRIIWAYDELQNLSMLKMQTPFDLFGVHLNNDTDTAQQDIILDRCYRNSRPVLVAAHGLGFGTARSEGLVQMFDEPSLWKEIGYEVESGELVAGNEVVLHRPTATSPVFLENHSSPEDLITFKVFEDKNAQAEWIADEIQRNLSEDELTTRDIVVVTLNALTAEEDTALVRSKLLKREINSHLAGVTTSPDLFFKEDSIAFTGIYRAKGNEAAMVYVINSEYAFSGTELIKKRNMLFSAITRSKAWVRVTGCGQKMTDLMAEFEKIKASGFKLSFPYPSKEEMERMSLINRDLTESEKKRRRTSLQEVTKLANDLAKGDLNPDDLDSNVRAQLSMIFGGKKDEPDRK